MILFIIIIWTLRLRRRAIRLKHTHNVRTRLLSLTQLRKNRDKNSVFMNVNTHKQRTAFHITHKPTQGIPLDKSRGTQSQHTQNHKNIVHNFVDNFLKIYIAISKKYCIFAVSKTKEKIL